MGSTKTLLVQLLALRFVFRTSHSTAVIKYNNSPLVVGTLVVTSSGKCVFMGIFNGISISLNGTQQ